MPMPRLSAEVYMMCNGKGLEHQRSNQSRGSAQHWRVSILSSGEVSLETHGARHTRKDLRWSGGAPDKSGSSAGCTVHDLQGAHDGRSMSLISIKASLENYAMPPLFVKVVMNSVKQEEKLD